MIKIVKPLSFGLSARAKPAGYAAALPLPASRSSSLAHPVLGSTPAPALKSPSRAASAGREGLWLSGGSFARPGFAPLHGRIFGLPVDLLPGRRLAGLWRYPAFGLASGAAVLVSFSYNEKLFRWLNKEDALALATDTVKAKFPPHLQDKIIRHLGPVRHLGH